MITTKIHRYLLNEIAWPTLLGLVIFTFVLLMGSYHSLVEMIIYRGVPLADVAVLFVKLLPSLLVITIPFAFLLGILLGFGRLSSDAETTALKANGIGLIEMTRPAFLLALITSLLTAYFSLYLQPEWKYQFKQKVFDIVNQRATIGFQANIINKDFDGMTILTKRVDAQDQQLHDIFISDERNPDEPTIITAESGKIVSDRRTSTVQFRLTKGTIHRTTVSKPDSYQIISFKNYMINLNIANQLEKGATRAKKIREQTAPELWQSYQQTNSQKKRLKILTRLFELISIPCTPLLFTLIGIPLGIQANRSGKSGGAALALLLAIGYYFMLSVAQTVAENGTIHPAIAMAIPNLICLIGGLTLFIGANNERTPALIRLFLNLIEQLKRLKRLGGPKK